jgi:hypothetical protein
MTTSNEVKVIEITEHEDGSATLSVDMSSELYAFFFEHGFRQVLMRALEEEQGRDDV